MGWKMQDGGHFVWASVSKSLWLLISLWWTTRPYLLNLEGEASGTYTHDDAMKRHFPHYWLLVWRIDWSLVDSSHKRTVVGSYDILLVGSLVKLLNTESHITYNVTVLPFPSTGQVRWFFIFIALMTSSNMTVEMPWNLECWEAAPRNGRIRKLVIVSWNFIMSRNEKYHLFTNVRFYKNIERHAAHALVSWPNPKQWVIVHTSDLMMIIRPSIYIFSLSSQEKWADWIHTAPHIYNGWLRDYA